MKIVITGGAGFICSNIAEELSEPIFSLEKVLWEMIKR